jgi:hypothetical protein
LRADVDAVWAELEAIERHVTWMADAESIELTAGRHAGVGTTFTCRTRVGPFRLTDRMEVTEWEPGRAMGVRHVGLVSGSGRFTLARRRRGRTRLTWEEELRFPLWMGGAPGAFAARPVLAMIWRGNLRRLARIVEAGPDAEGPGDDA